ncbi:DUF2442 domain-containing protein [Aquibium sp. ELW1220]|uniref:DUF2442 domain-containing protein n=1 Tax=Aquibium sp. ELW1220 TaxID=2976766 RepID=UPI0025B249AF|nr:DUF2442 domain-containing protein [Aquibium sp. ELW1220]MDN2583715.1 DUF2442 domain-containing protein [Aquibium sp. ELW1220]
MTDVSDDRMDAAERRGGALRSGPLAVSARFDGDTRRIVVELTNGCSFAFPVALVEGLSDAKDADLAEVEPLGDGYGLHWERLDVDYSVQGLLAGIFGTAAWMARRAGRATSPAKAEAARANGAKGGRPRKRA